jgi:hypothetical protein
LSTENRYPLWWISGITGVSDRLSLVIIELDEKKNLKKKSEKEVTVD